MDFDGMYFKHALNSGRMPIFTKMDYYTIELEIVENHPFLHLKIDNWCKQTVKDIPWVVDELKHMLSCFGYPIVFGCIAKEGKNAVHKFLKRMGFEELAEWRDQIIYQLHIKEPENYDDIVLEPEIAAAAALRDERILRHD